MLSPFPLTREELDLHVDYHTQVVHLYGKWCIGGLGSKGSIESFVEDNTSFYLAQPAYELVVRLYAAGVDGMSLYQSETLVRMGYLKELLAELGRPETVAGRAATVPKPIEPRSEIGLDWHAHIGWGAQLAHRSGGCGALILPVIYRAEFVGPVAPHIFLRGVLLGLLYIGFEIVVEHGLAQLG